MTPALEQLAATTTVTPVEVDLTEATAPDQVLASSPGSIDILVNSVWCHPTTHGGIRVDHRPDVA